MEIWRLKYWTQGPGHRKRTEEWKEKEEGKKGRDEKRKVVKKREEKEEGEKKWKV